MKAHKMIEYRANKSFARLPPQILSNNLSTPALVANSIGSQSNVSSIHLVNDSNGNQNASKLQVNNSRKSSELSMDLSGSVDSEHQPIIQKLTESQCVLKQVEKLVASLQKGADIINTNMNQMETHLEKLRRYYFKLMLNEVKSIKK
ncbi:Hypothetical_protein [Hexamita inflata]|uniref:Hypothetical_protein n=1 Tax=Hexamita inflata TaxID=28002 RepID=A0AA86U5Y5_9EUKA|nr:Hypothetical protein HINF_LOCUS31695 [Hexamita inflata]